MRAPELPIVLIYGNCQAEYLQMIMASVPCLRGKLEFRVVALHKLTPETWAELGPDVMRRVVLFWDQIHLWGSAAGQEQLRSLIPEDCRTIRFPMMSINAFWPFRMGKMPPIEGRPPPAGHYDDGDRVAMTLRTSDLDDSSLYDVYLSKSRAALPDVCDMFERFEIPRMHSLDAQCDVDHTDFVMRNLISVQLFTSVPHLSPSSLRYLAGRLGCATLCPEFCKQGDLTQDLNALLDLHAGFDLAELPIHPAVAEMFGLRYIEPGQIYKWHHYRWTHRQYILSLIREAAYAR